MTVLDRKCDASARKKGGGKKKEKIPVEERMHGGKKLPEMRVVVV